VCNNALKAKIASLDIYFARYKRQRVICVHNGFTDTANAVRKVGHSDCNKCRILFQLLFIRFLVLRPFRYFVPFPRLLQHSSKATMSDQQAEASNGINRHFLFIFNTIFGPRPVRISSLYRFFWECCRSSADGPYFRLVSNFNIQRLLKSVA
jgi:hypothetical protein